MTFITYTRSNLRCLLNSALMFSLILLSTKGVTSDLSGYKKLSGNTWADTARFSLSGRIVDEKNEPLPGATVFISNSKWAASADSEGMFKLSGIPAGNYEVLVRMMGFVTFTKVFTFSDKPINVNLMLKTDAIALNEVKISAKPDENRERYLKIFTQNFIGESENARQSQILNSDVLRFKFDKRTGTLTASATDLIKIKNNGLGYNLNYLLNSFSFNEKYRAFGFGGKVYFEELSGDEKQQNTWTKNRSTAYYGSMKHFLKTLFAGTTAAEGFEIYRVSDADILSARVTTRAGALRASDLIDNLTPVSPESLISKTADPDKQTLNLPMQLKGLDTTRLYVLYLRNGEPRRFYNSDGHINITTKDAQISRIYQIGSGNILLNSDGTLANEKNVMVEGYWAWQRVGEFLPHEVESSFPNTTGTKQQPTPIQANTSPVEKIHIQMDRPWYLAGDTAWLKLYVVNGFNKPSIESKIAIVELIDKNKHIVKNLRLPIDAGTSWGALPLSDTLIQQGAYIIRAYTDNMLKNNNPFFYRTIRITDPKLDLQPLTTTKTELLKADSLKVQFWPEGGALITNVSSRVALTATAAGKPVAKLKGYVLNESGSHIAKFETNEWGVATIALKPLKQGEYWAVTELPNGKEKRFALPRAQAAGIAMAIKQNNEHIKVYLNTDNSYKTVANLVISANDRLQYQSETSVGTAGDSIVIAKSDLPDGLLQFSLYRADKTLIAERLVYNLNIDQQLKVNFSPAKITYNPHDKVDIKVAVTDADNNPVSGSFSVSINNEEDVPDEKQNGDDIFTTLLMADNGLRKSLKDHDLTAFDPEQLRKLDELLITGKPQKNPVKQIAPPQYANIIPSGSPTIEGQVNNTKGKPASGVVGVMFPTSGAAFTTISDEGGRFTFKNIDAKRGDPFYLVAKDKNKDLSAVPDKYIAPDISDEIMADTLATPLSQTYVNYVANRLENLKKQQILGVALKEVTIKEKKIEPGLREQVLEYSNNLAGPGRADQVLTFIDLLPCGGGPLVKCLAMRLNGVYEATMTDSVKGELNNLVRKDGQRITVFVDGVERDITHMMGYEVAAVEYLRGAAAAVYGMRAANGVIVITTKRGGIDYAGFEQEHYVPGSTKSAPVIGYKFENGLDIAGKFYAPDYKTHQSNNIDIWRPTVYWDPNVVTGLDGTAKISFFTNSAPGTYRVTVEGIDHNGRIARQVFRYTVKE